MAKKDLNEETQEIKAEAPKPEEKQQGFKAYAAFEFRGKQYAEGDVFLPPSDVYPDPNLDEFRRVNSRKSGEKGHAFYYEVLSSEKGKEPSVFRVVLPVE